MLRPLAYILVAWILVAMVGGLAHVLHLSIMLPSTSAILVAHLGFAQSPGVPAGLAVALVLGYLEDLHQGAPVGTLCLAHAVAFLVMRWVSRRISAHGRLVRACASTGAVLVVNVVALAVLLVLADGLGAGRDALVAAFWGSRWQALATALASVPAWGLMDGMFGALRLTDRGAQRSLGSPR